MCEMCSKTELEQYSIEHLTDAHKPLLSTVEWVDNRQDAWIECINDDGDKVRLVPDMTGWQDGRKEVFVMNCTTGINTKLFFRQDNGSFFTHSATRREDIEDVMWKIPWPVLDWAAEKAH